MATLEDTMVENMFTSRKKAVPATDSTSKGREDFEAVYRRYVKPVYAFVAYRVRVRAEAEDLTSQIFEKAWRNYVIYDSGKAKISTWLYAIARNCVTDHLRQAGRTPYNAGLDSDIRSSGEDDPEPRLQALELRRELQDAIACLDEREREIVALKFGASMTNRDIAALLDISETNAGTILYRSLQKMKTILEGGNGND